MIIIGVLNVILPIYIALLVLVSVFAASVVRFRRKKGGKEVFVNYELMNDLARELRHPQGYDIRKPNQYDLLLIELTKAILVATERLNCYTKILGILTFILVGLTVGLLLFTTILAIEGL
jgi:hypothetical protein